jgi:hypothetical protein
MLKPISTANNARHRHYCWAADKQNISLKNDHDASGGEDENIALSPCVVNSVCLMLVSGRVGSVSSQKKRARIAATPFGYVPVWIIPLAFLLLLCGVGGALFHPLKRLLQIALCFRLLPSILLPIQLFGVGHEHQIFLISH